MQHFTASDGAEIAYSDEGAGRPLLLLHGLMAHCEFFEPQRDLADRFRLIGLDFRGHGATGGQGRFDRLVGDVNDLLRTLDLQGVIGIGWSLGASVLWRVLGGPERQRLAGSVIVDMTPRVRNDGDWQLGMSPELCDARTAAIRNDYSNFAIAAGQAIFAQPIADGQKAFADWASSEFARNNPAAIDSAWTSLVEQDLRAELSQIAQPSLIVHGSKSQLYGPATADHLVHSLPRARAVPFERSGHAPHIEQPEDFNRLIHDFAAGLPAVREAQVTT